MHLIYTSRTSGFSDGENYRNPKYFTSPDKRATSVSIEGDYPEVAKAYESAGVKVNQGIEDKSSSDELKQKTKQSKS